MFEKLEELAKNNKKISDFHIRSGSPLAYKSCHHAEPKRRVFSRGRNGKTCL